MPHLLDLAPELLDEILGYVLANDDRDDDNVSRTNVTYYPETKSYRPRLIPLATTCPQFYELNRRRSAGNPRCELLMCFETDATPADDFNDRKIKVYQEYDNLRKGECRNLMILGTKVAEQSQLGYFDTLDWGNPSGSLCDCDNCHRQWTCDILNARPAGQDKISRVIHSLLPHFTNVTTASFHDDDYGIPLPTFAEGIRTLVQGCLGLTELFINVAFSFQNPFESYRIEELDTSKPYARLSVLRLQLKLETGWPEMPAMLPHVNGSPRLLGALRRILEFPSKTVETFQLSTIGPWIEFPHEGGEDYLVEEGGQDGHWGLPSIKTLDIYLNESVVGSLRLDRVFYLGPNITNLKMAVEGPKPLQCDCESDRRVGNVDFRDKFKKCFNSEIEMYGGLNKTIREAVACLAYSVETLEILDIGCRHSLHPDWATLVSELVEEFHYLAEISTNTHLTVDGDSGPVPGLDSALATYRTRTGRRQLSCHSYPMSVISHDYTHDAIAVEF